MVLASNRLSVSPQLWTDPRFEEGRAWATRFEHLVMRRRLHTYKSLAYSPLLRNPASQLVWINTD